MSDARKQGRLHLWRHRGRRFAAGVNVCLSVGLAAALAAMVVVLAHRYYARADWSLTGYCTLSDKTRGLLASLDEDVRIVAFLRREQSLYEHVRNLLEAYEYDAGRLNPRRLKVDIVDPDRELARTRELVSVYDVQDGNVIVIEAAGRRQYVEAGDLLDLEMDFDDLLATGRATRRLVGYRGEQAISSAIQSVTQAAHPIVYVLTGHGERDIEDYGGPAGFAAIVRALRRDNMTVRPLLLAEAGAVPEDASALIVAGPGGRLALAEEGLIEAYLQRSGRLLALHDAGVVSGLEPLLAKWGVVLRRDVVVDPRRTLTGRDVYVTQFGDHPVTQRLRGSAAVFMMPRSVTPAPEFGVGAPESADRPRVTVLAACSRDGWAETDLDESPARYDAGADSRGPVGVAVAVEKGGVSGVDLEIKPTRLVVIGDSDFVSNGALDGSVGGNQDLFLSAMNWLVERDALMAIAPKPPHVLSLGMNRDRVRAAFAILVLVGPVLVAIAGLAVWVRRRRP